MKDILIYSCIVLTVVVIRVNGQHRTIEPAAEFHTGYSQTSAAPQDTLSDLPVLLNTLAVNSDNNLFKYHCSSIINVIQARGTLSRNDSAFLKQLYTTFSDSTVEWNASELSSYEERKRPFIISWTSPTDGVVSLAWLLLPENWDPGQTYPLYVHLHGLSSPYESPIEYMTYFLRPDSIMNKSFEDGYYLFPWGRGNIWYQGIGETDIWEAIDTVESLVHIDPQRKYLMGHSMGGYGVWAIGQKSPGKWAALGIYAGALWYPNYELLNAESAQKLKNIPVYIVCGDRDGLLGTNRTAYQLLQNAGNVNTIFVTFPGGHESLLENWQNMYQWIKNWDIENPNAVHSNGTQAATEFTLYDNYPNPFNPSTTISYTLDHPAHVKIDICDLTGKRIAAPVDRTEPAGTYRLVWDAKYLSSGIYFCRVRTEGKTTLQKEQKMILMK